MGIPLKWRRTKTKYLRWFDDPTLLSNDGSCEVIAFPNGYRELWVRSKDLRRGMRLVFSDGAAGLGIQVQNFALGPGMTIAGNQHPNYEVLPPKGEPLPDFADLSICQYKSDDWSQAFKAWYAGTGEYPGRREVSE